MLKVLIITVFLLNVGYAANLSIEKKKYADRVEAIRPYMREMHNELGLKISNLDKFWKKKLEVSSIAELDYDTLEAFENKKDAVLAKRALYDANVLKYKNAVKELKGYNCNTLEGYIKNVCIYLKGRKHGS